MQKSNACAASESSRYCCDAVSGGEQVEPARSNAGEHTMRRWCWCGCMMQDRERDGERWRTCTESVTTILPNTSQHERTISKCIVLNDQKFPFACAWQGGVLSRSNRYQWKLISTKWDMDDMYVSYEVCVMDIVLFISCLPVSMQFCFVCVWCMYARILCLNVRAKSKQK